MTDMARLIALTQGGDMKSAYEAILADGAIPQGRRGLFEVLLSNQDSTLDDGSLDSKVDEADHLECRLARLQKQNAQLRAVLDDIADALGACGDCFGSDESCPECDGEGSPGAFRPRRAAFDFFLRPVIDRLKRRPVPRAGAGHEVLKQRSETT